MSQRPRSRERVREALALVRLDGARRTQAARAVGRTAAARRAGPRACHSPVDPAARRAAVQSRCEAAGRDAQRNPRHPAAPRHHGCFRHPRPGRSPEHVRQGRGDEGWPARTVRHAGRRSTSIRHRPSSPLSSAARTGSLAWARAMARSELERQHDRGARQGERPGRGHGAPASHPDAERRRTRGRRRQPGGGHDQARHLCRRPSTIPCRCRRAEIIVEAASDHGRGIRSVGTPVVCLARRGHDGLREEPLSAATAVAHLQTTCRGLALGRSGTATLLLLPIMRSSTPSASSCRCSTSCVCRSMRRCREAEYARLSRWRAGPGSFATAFYVELILNSIVVSLSITLHDAARVLSDCALSPSRSGPGGHS